MKDRRIETALVIRERKLKRGYVEVGSDWLLPVVLQPVTDEGQVRTGHRLVAWFLPGLHGNPGTHAPLVDGLSTDRQAVT